MELTVKKKKDKIDWKGLDLGTVVELGNGTYCVVYHSPQEADKCLLILKCSPTLNFRQAFGFLGYPVIRIVGKISEIIVEEI